jgi:hypothetical protein
VQSEWRRERKPFSTVKYAHLSREKNITSLFYYRTAHIVAALELIYLWFMIIKSRLGGGKKMEKWKSQLQSVDGVAKKLGLFPLSPICIFYLTEWLDFVFNSTGAAGAKLVPPPPPSCSWNQLRNKFYHFDGTPVRGQKTGFAWCEEEDFVRPARESRTLS